MRTRLRVVLMAVVLGMGVLVPALPSTADTPSGDWVSVDRAMVNKLGGVNVSGQVSCAGTYDLIAEGLFEVDGVPLVLAPDDKVNLLANNDNYTVSQSVGRKTMIQVTHGSSRMSPCFVQILSNPDGSAIDSQLCEEGGAPCRWTTDHFGYDSNTFGPLFDYSPNGKFKTGTMSVRNESIGLAVQIHHADDSWDTYIFGEDETSHYSFTSTSIRAVSYR